MFTVKQETESGHKMWPGISHVYTERGPRGIDVVFAMFEAGGDLRFPASEAEHTIYVMNEAGATVARYDLGYRHGLAPVDGLVQADPAKLAA